MMVSSPFSAAWLHSARFDLVFILSPPLVASLAALALSGFPASAPLPMSVWLFAFLCIDGGHVYGTVFRTYLDRDEYRKRKTLFLTAPFLVWGAGVLLFTARPEVFWWGFLYAVVFHFIRQQYGFMMLYAHKEGAAWKRWVGIDKAVIYLATLYPMIWWHTHLPRSFFWFGDIPFLSGLPRPVERLALVVYLGVALAYAVKEVFLWARYRVFSLPKQLVLAGTALSWLVGIVWLNNRLAFTLTSCLSHGIPYLGLVWLSGRRQFRAEGARFPERRLFSLPAVPIFLGVIGLLAFVEKGLWDVLLTRAHLSLFRCLAWVPPVSDPRFLRLIIPLLATPSITHYILDAFIWRLRVRESRWRRVFFQEAWA